MKNDISVTNKVLLDLLANSLFNANIEIDFNGVSLEELFKEAQAQTVVAIALDTLPKQFGECDSAVYEKWQLMAFSVIQKNINQMYANVKLEELFRKADIPICTIKGFASNYYYPKKHLRQMGDIDFIVPIEKVKEGKQLLIENGFECTDSEEEHDFHIGYKKNKNIYEMHKGITSFLDENGYIDKYIKDIFADMITAEFNDVSLNVPSKFAHGLIMLLHMQRHMMDGGGIGLRHLCDWATFVNCIDNYEWLNIFEKNLKKIKLWKFAQVLSKAASIYLKMPEKAWFSEVGEDISEQLIVDILLGGNFGRKDIKRYQEVFFLNKKGNNKLKSYAIGLILKVYSWKAFYKHHKYLLPIGLISYCFRTVFLVLFKGKKINYVQTRKSGSIRNNVYNDIFK